MRMIASPVNPSELLVVRRRYGVLPPLPATPGFEGVGLWRKRVRGSWVSGLKESAWP